MKNHIKIDGKLLQTNKKWSHLRQKQKECISNWLREEYVSCVQVQQRRPKNHEHTEIILAVMEKIHEQDIWIPRMEVEKYYKSKVGRWYGKIENIDEN